VRIGADREGPPLDGIEMAEDRRDRLALLLRGRLLEVEDGPVHLALGEVAAEVARDPVLEAVELRRPVAAGVHLERVVEPAVARAFLVPRRARAAAARSVGGRLRAEVAL